MSVYDYSPDPALNQYIAGIYIGEGWLAPDANNAFRQFMADVNVLATGSAGGTVKSVDVSGGTTGLTTSGGPVIVSGTITLDGVLNADHGGLGAADLVGYIKANGSGPATASAGVPGSDVVGDIPGNANNINGTLATAQGGTGQNFYTDGQLLIGSSIGNVLNRSTLTAGPGIVISNGHGTISIGSTPSEGGTIPLDDGTVTTPSLTFLSDLDTGIYHPAVGQIAYTCNGAQVGLWAPGGLQVNADIFCRQINTGYNLINPTDAVGIEHGLGRTGNGLAYIDFHASAGSDFDARIIRNAGANGSFDISNTGTGALNISSAGQAPTIFYTNGIERMRVDYNGNVGVNVSAPASQLHVKGADNGMHFGVSGATYGLRITCRTTEAAIEAVDTTLIASYQPLTLGGSQVSIKETGTQRALFGGGVCQFWGGNYLYGQMSQFVDNGEIRQMGNAGNVGFRSINTTAGGALGRLVWQATTNGFAAVYGTGFTYDPQNSCTRPEADAGLDLGTTAFRFRNGYLSGGIVCSSVNVNSGAANGSIQLQPGQPGNTGFVGFYQPNGTRVGYVGFGANGGPLNYLSENNQGHHFGGGPASFSNDISISGAVWISGAGSGYNFANRDGSSPSYMWYATGSKGRLWASDTGRECQMDNQGRWLPAVDGVAELGTNGQRWLSVWSVNSVLQTSDAREKRWRGGLNDNELAASKALAREIGIYQWLRDLETDGENAKLQCGLLAQTVLEVFSANGLDALDYGFIQYDEWPEREDSNPDGDVIVHPGGNRYSIMFPDILAFMMVGQEQRLAALEEKLG